MFFDDNQLPSARENDRLRGENNAFTAGHKSKAEFLRSVRTYALAGAIRFLLQGSSHIAIRQVLGGEMQLLERARRQQRPLMTRRVSRYRDNVLGRS
jgi:hypothetical protein